MIVTQDSLMKQIAEQEGADIETIRKIFKTAEDIIFVYFSSTAPSENIMMKLFKGISLERKYIKEKEYSKGMFKNVDCPEHVNIKASSSKYYSKKVNDKLFRQK